MGWLDDAWESAGDTLKNPMTWASGGVTAPFTMAAGTINKGRDRKQTEQDAAYNQYWAGQEDVWKFPQQEEKRLHGWATDSGPSKMAQYQIGASGLQEKSAWDQGLGRSGGGGRQGAFDLTGRTGTAASRLGSTGLQQRTDIIGQDEKTKTGQLQALHKGRMEAWAAKSRADSIRLSQSES